MKCGPDNCPIVAFSDLTPAEQRVERKRLGAKMLAEGFTETQVAKHFGVSQQTISSDQSTLPKTGNVKDRGKDTLGRKKSTGRPRGQRTGPQPERRKAAPATEQAAASLVLDEGKSYEQAAAEIGVGVQVVKTSVAREEGRREPQVAREDLSMTAQEKFDTCIRQEKRRLSAQFEQRVRDEARKRVDEIVLPHWKKQIETAQLLFSKRRALMDKDTFNTIRRALHPDSRLSISDKKLAQAFDAFMALEKYLLNETDSPTRFERPDGSSGIPDNLAAWDKMRVKKSSKRTVNAVRPR